MFAYRTGRRKRYSRSAPVLALAALAVLITGCGGAGESASTAPGGAPATADADPADLAVIEGWSRALSAGDIEAAASYFAVPSSAENGGLRIEIRSLEDAVTFNGSLPCGAELLTATTAGDVTTATFRLADRPGGDCGAGAGGRAATAFRIEDEEITDWQRVAVPGGGDEAPGGSAGGAPI